MRRLLALTGITAALALALTVGAPVGAVQAASTPPPITFLPDVAKAAKGASVTGVAAMDYFAIVMQKFMASPEVQAAAKAKAAGVPLAPAQTVTLATQASKWSIPAVPMKGFTKVVGGAGAVMLGSEIGFSVGKEFSTAIGLNTKAGLCEFAIIGTITGTDCSEQLEFVPNYVPNMDVTGMPSGWYTTNVQPYNWGVAAGVPGEAEVLLNLTATPAFKATSARFAGTASVSGTCANGGAPNSPLSAVGFWRSTTTGVLSERIIATFANNDSTNRLGYPACGNTTLTFDVTGTRPTATGGPWVFDYARFQTANGAIADRLWYPEGHALFNPGQSADPERTLKCEIFGTDGMSYFASTAPFRESAGGVPPMVCPTLPAEVWPDTTIFWEVGGGQERELWRSTSSPEFKESATMPECMDGSCLLVLEKSGVSCFDLAYECADWFTAPDKNTTYTCRWGNNPVALERCTSYAPTFKPDANTKGELYGDPTTGAPLPFPNGSADQVNQADCFPTGWGVLNPFEWVVKPVGCALRAAFVPRQSVIDSTLGAIPAKLGQTTPGLYLAAISEWDFEPVNGCSGLRVDMSWLPGGGIQYYMPACPGDFFADIAPIFKIFMYGGVAVGGFFGITRHIGTLVNSRGLGG